jgi:hypothetical protein
MRTTKPSSRALLLSSIISQSVNLKLGSFCIFFPDLNLHTFDAISIESLPLSLTIPTAPTPSGVEAATIVSLISWFLSCRWMLSLI